MTLGFDENLSFRLVDQLADWYPHTSTFGHTGRPDEAIWRYASGSVENFRHRDKGQRFLPAEYVAWCPTEGYLGAYWNSTTRAIADVLRSRFPSNTLWQNRTRRFLNSHRTKSLRQCLR